MAEYSGTSLYLKFGSQVLSADYRTFEPSEEMKLAVATAGADAAESHIVVRKDGRATCELVDQTAGTALWTAVVPGTSGTLEWGPEGTSSTS